MFQQSVSESGSCIDSNTDYTLAVDHYQCECVHGYASGAGGNCDIDVDECASAPCQNGAACADSTTTNSSIATGGYRCTCVDGFASGSCDYSPIVAAYASDCNLSVSSDAEVFGDGNCAIDVDECISSPCQNGAGCKESASAGLPAGSYTCLCQRGFANGECEYSFITEYSHECSVADGGNCDLDVNECASNPCQNGAECLDSSTAEATVSISRYLCRCDDELWGGRDCEVDRHEPCSHFAPLHSGFKFRICGGSCVVESECNACLLVDEDMVNCGGSCVPRTCPPEPHPCGSNPCHNGGSCYASLVTIDRYGPFNCSCTPGWNGITCESNIDECLSDPCLNGAACLDRLPGHGFACECTPGFTGLVCEVDQLTGHADRVCGPLLFFDGCDGACQPAKCVHRLAQVNIGGPMPTIQSSVAVATFSTSVDIVAQGTQSGGSALQSALFFILSASNVDIDRSVFQVAAINQTVEASVQLPGYSEDYNSPVVEHCYSNVFALDYTGDMSATESGRTCQRCNPHLILT